jgi:hypothetical protein
VRRRHYLWDRLCAVHLLDADGASLLGFKPASAPCVSSGGCGSVCPT